MDGPGGVCIAWFRGPGRRPDRDPSTRVAEVVNPPIAMPPPETAHPMLGIIVVGHAGSLTIGILGGKIVVIPPEDPTWGSVIAHANAAAAVAKVEGAASQLAVRFAREAIAAATKVVATAG